MNPALRKQIHRRNLVRFRQILADLTDILQKIESGELEDIWFIRRVSCALLGATKMTDDEGHTRWIGWKKGKLVVGPIKFERPTAFQNLRETYLAGVPATPAPVGFTSQILEGADPPQMELGIEKVVLSPEDRAQIDRISRLVFHDAAEEEKKRRDGVVLQ